MLNNKKLWRMLTLKHMKMEKTQVNKTTETVKAGFKKEIGLFGGISIIGGIMIGSGIFYLGSYVLQRTHMSMGLALLCWIIGGIVSLLGGLCFAELGASRPVAGGMVVYLNEAYHPVVGFAFGFTSLLLSGAGSIAALAIAIPVALKSFFNINDLIVKCIAIVLIIGLTIYNYFGVKQGSILQNISMIAKLVPIAIIMIAALLFGKQTPNLSLMPVDGSAVSLNSILGMIAFATVATLWAYDGWSNLNNVAEEMKNPKKNVPLSLIISIVGISIIYTLFNFCIYKVVPQNEVVSMINGGNFYLGTEAAKRIFGSLGAVIVVTGMVIAMFSSLNGMIIAFPRIYYAMAKEGHFFKSYGQLHPKYKVPTTALIGQAVICIILVMLRNLDQLTSLVIFAEMIFNILVIVAVIIYRKKYHELERPYKIWGYPYTVIITAIIYVGLMLNSLFEDPLTAVIGLVVPVIGAFVYFYFDKQIKKHSDTKC